MAKLSIISSGPMAVVVFFRQAREELKKVSWPTRQTTTRYTVIVIISSVVVGLVTGGIDLLLARLIEKLV